MPLTSPLIDQAITLIDRMTSVIAILRQLVRSPSHFTPRQHFNFSGTVRNDIDQVVKANKFMVHHFLDVAARIAHYVVEEVGVCVHPQNLACVNLVVITIHH